MTKKQRANRRKILQGHLRALEGLRARMGPGNVGLPTVNDRIAELKAILKEES